MRAKKANVPAEAEPQARDLPAEIATQKRILADAQDEMNRLRDVRPGLLLDATAEGEQRLDDHDIAAVRAARAIERTQLVIGRLEADLAAANAAAEQERRMDTYAQGRDAALEFRRLVEEDYASAARAVADIMFRLRNLSVVCDQANRSLPANQPRIDCEAFLQSRGGRPTPSLYSLVYLPGSHAAEPDFWNEIGPV